MAKKTYIIKDGSTSTYNYDDKKYARNNEIWKLQKRKSYYKNVAKDMSKVATLEKLIEIEKRKAGMEEN